MVKIASEEFCCDILIIHVALTLGRIIYGTCTVSSESNFINKVGEGDIQIIGTTHGGTPTSIIWTRNGKLVTTGSVYGGRYRTNNAIQRTHNPSCLDNQYMLHLSIIGFLPGNYTYYVSNDQTRVNVSSSVILEGIVRVGMKTSESSKRQHAANIRECNFSI